MPSIVFSSLDLHLLPDFIKIVMDDSLWAMLPSLVQQTGESPPPDSTAPDIKKLVAQPIPARARILLNKGIPLKLYIRMMRGIP